MDLRIGRYIVTERPFNKDPWLAWGTVNPHDPAEIASMFQEPEPLPYTLSPHERILACSEKTIEIPESFVGMIGLRSTWARLGLMAPTTFADPGFRGTLTMELFNASRYGLLIQPGDAIWSMVLTCAPQEPMYQGRYQGQKGITLPKAFP